MKSITSRVLLFFTICLPSLAYSQASHLALEFKRVLPRGAIAAITDPEYIPAGEAKIDKNTWVLGVIINDQPIAYSLNLLNRHEVVNDIKGDTAFAAVW